MVWEDHVDNLLGDSGQHIKDGDSGQHIKDVSS